MEKSIRLHAPGQPAQNIPNISGVYAWHMPLYIFEETPAPQMVEFYNRLFLWELEGDNKGEVYAKLAWKRVQLKLKPHERHDPLEREETQKILESDTAQEWLKCAGVFAPPLYIGHTGNLRDRYQQHTNAKSASASNFAGRFRIAAEQLGHKLRVDSLIFAYLGTGLSKQENIAIESFLMRAAMPPFSDI